MSAIRSWTLLAWLLVGATLPVSGHVGMPFVLLEGKAGRFPVRVVVQQPEVVPGLAHVDVRVLEGVPLGVTVLPLHWETDRKGAPRPDRARAVPGDPGLYEGELWFMGAGAYGVVVEVEGPDGGTLVVPANSLARSQARMPGWMQGMLAVLGVVLVLGWCSIGAAAFRESTVAGSVQGRLWKGTAGGVLALILALGATWGGAVWWRSEHWFHASRVQAQNRTLSLTAEQGRLEFKVGRGRSRFRGSQWDPEPDHGRLFHAFLVGDGEQPHFLHLHPEEDASGRLLSGFRALGPGRYRAFLDVTHSMGTTQTLTNELELSATLEGPGLTDPDDSESRVAPVSLGQVLELEDHLRFRCELIGRARVGEAIRILARFTDGGGRPCRLEPYLRMPGHAVIATTDGEVFSHLHPAGNLSMAAARRFALRAGGTVAAREADVNCGDLGMLPADVVNRLLDSGEVAFPVVLPRRGNYRVWVQARIAGRVRTGCVQFVVAD